MGSTPRRGRGRYAAQPILSESQKRMARRVKKGIRRTGQAEIREDLAWYHLDSRKASLGQVVII